MATGNAASVWGPIEEGLRDLESGIKRSGPREVNSLGLRNVARQVVRDFFRAVRPQLAAAGVVGVDEVDALFQTLLQLANKRSPRSAYLALTRELNAVRVRTEIEYERRASTVSTAKTLAFDATERAIVDRLTAILPSAAIGYQQALRDLQSGDRLSWRGTAAELRESGRETLDHLAPDAEVMAAPGFKLEKDESRPTQKQKMRHIVRSRKVPEGAQKVPEDLVNLIEVTASFARSTYSRGATATHAAPSRAEVRQLKRYVDTLLCELLEIDV